jgi:hypothetical protein
MPVMKFRRGAKPSDVIKWEIDTEFSRDTFTLLAGTGSDRAIAVGTPLGMIANDAAVDVIASASPGNTGNGVLTLAEPAFTSAVRPGRYVATLDDTAADGGKFNVEGPDGKIVGVASVGVAFGKQVKFTIADGATDFAKGDQFFIDVAIPPADDAGKVVAWDPTATNGSEVLMAIAINSVTAADGVDAENAVLAVSSHAIAYEGGIVWPDAVTAEQKTKGLRDLAERWIKVKS